MGRSNNIFEDNSINIRFPDTMKIHEHKAPTDESIRLMEEMHDKAMKNIIAKVKVEDNVLKGEAFAVDQPWNTNDIKLIFKFSINGLEYNVEKEVSRFEFFDDYKEITDLSMRLREKAKGIMLYYTLKHFTAMMYEKITNERVPEFLLK